MSKIIAFLDVDGVLLNFNEMAIKVINQTYGTNHSLEHIPQNWGFEELIPKDANPNLWWKRMPDNWPGLLKPLPYAPEYLLKLQRQGARVILITSLNPKQLPSRIAGLAKSGMKYDEIYAVPYGMKKSDFINPILERHNPRWSFFLDDKAENAFDVAKNCEISVVYTLDYAYNRECLKDIDRRDQEVDFSLRLIVYPNLVTAYEESLRFVQTKSFL